MEERKNVCIMHTFSPGSFPTYLCNFKQKSSCIMCLYVVQYYCTSSTHSASNAQSHLVSVQCLYMHLEN